MRGKQGIAPLLIILFLVLILLVLYLVMYLPIPLFTKIRMIANYFMIIIFWIVLQVGLIFAYYEMGKFASKNFSKVKGLVKNIDFRVKRYIILHS